jgi:hypothetical protein
MATTRERNIRDDEAAKVGREKAKDQPSVEEMIDQRGGHVTGQQFGNLKADGKAPLTEQAKRNGEGGEADKRDSKADNRTERNASETRPSHP